MVDLMVVLMVEQMAAYLDMKMVELKEMSSVGKLVVVMVVDLAALTVV